MDATFSIDLPSANAHGMPTPTGKGFFISPDGYFVTAAHVITKDGLSTGEIRGDIEKGWLSKETSMTSAGQSCQFVQVEHVLPEFDFVLLRVDFDKNSSKEWLKGKNSFPYLKVSKRQLEIGEPVYSFGYPLSSGYAKNFGDNMFSGSTSLSPRLTSAIISSQLEKTEMVMSSSDPKHYVLDKPLNYGNSGGPIIATETGNVNGICSRFQPIYIPQPHLNDNNGNQLYVMIPSLYGIVSNINNDGIIKLLQKLNIPLTDK